jgi:hypothetical protein
MGLNEHLIGFAEYLLLPFPFLISSFKFQLNLYFLSFLPPQK